ncbi:MAG: hypothetical protein D6748_09500 [Calditrichaeota bacterium]|nr:MAG: hypothetical protein D6748_09500 [Calditrichota bacterium]
MGKINLKRVVLGGLLAGLILNITESVLNIWVVGEQWKQVLEKYGMGESPGTLVWYYIWGFLTGILIVWIYAAIRPRFGPGPKTAILAGEVVWVSMWFLGFLGYGISGLFPMDLVFITIIWGFVELAIAGLAGAWLYKEEETTPTS